MTTNPVPADVCPTCSAPVIDAPSGLLLDPQPHRLGVLRPDGSTLTVREVVAAAHEGRPAGFHSHQCGETTQPTPEQGELFALPTPPQE